MIAQALTVVLGYLLGSIPFGLVLTRAAGLGDVRSIGSGSIGATNVLRTGNKLLALLTVLLDAGKGAAAVLIAAQFGPDMKAYAAAFAFLGHLFPVWLGFKGGKGVATSGGILLAYAWLLTREIQPTEVVGFLAVLVLLRHHANIRRLIRGEESRIRLSKA